MDLYLLRHGEAGRSMAVSTVDAKRKLTDSGKEEVQDAAKGILSLGIKFDMIASSPLARAAETAEIVSRNLKPKKRADYWDELKPEGSRKAVYTKLSMMRPDSTVLLVGHEPYLTTVACDMSGTRPGRILLKKGGLIRIQVGSFSPEPRGVIRWLLSPKILKSLGE